MKRKYLVSTLFVILLSSCLPSLPQTQDVSTPVSDSDLQATAAVLSQQTLEALPTQTLPPTETAIIFTPSQTPTQPTPTETVNPVLLTLTATLLAGTPNESQTAASSTTTTQDVSSTSTSTSTFSPAPLGSPQPLFYGTLPPDIPSGTISLFNKADADVYISLRCVTKDGHVTILEYPVKQNIIISAPTGKYTYVAWVGGRQFDGAFSLDNENILTITFLRNKINLKKN